MSLTDVNHDLDLLRRMRTGDSDAMSAIYERHQGPLYRFALLRCGSAATAADVVQDVFVALIEGKLAFDPTRGALASFLFGVARNFLLKRDEAARRFLPLTTGFHGGSADSDSDDESDIDILDPQPTPLESIIADQRAEILRAALAQIAPHYRDVLILYEMQDLSYVEIAHICNIDIGTVRSRLSRARARLTALLADEFAPPPGTAPLSHNTTSDSSESKRASL
jgi:RNA polymerase sigma-70 factor, ECF subfamily